MISDIFNNVLINSSFDLKKRELITKDKVYHFIGIGGCGMSGIAKVMSEMGFKIQGSDIHESDYTKELQALNQDIRIIFKHDETNVYNADVIVFSDVIDNANPELKYAKTHDIPIVPRAVMLDYIMNIKNKTSIAVSGTHGKTTTTSFISILLKESGKQPTFINGGIINRYKTNAEYGQGNFSIFEACEAFGNIKYFNPSISIITNVELDHMEYYKTTDNLVEHFNGFISRTKDLCLLDIDTDLSQKLYKKYKNSLKVKTLSLSNPYADIFAKDVCVSLNSISFVAVFKKDQEYRELLIEMPIIGNHNVKNALCAVYVGSYIGLTDEEIQQACKKFTGNKHRFSNVATVNGITIIDDYGHHPSEVSSVIDTAREIISKNSDITVIFEPHKYTRFAACWDDFKKVFSTVSNLIITPIFEAGESKISGITPENFVKEISNDAHLKHCIAIKSFDDIALYINEFCKEFDLVLSFSAGALKDYIYSIPSQLDKLKKHTQK